VVRVVWLILLGGLILGLIILVLAARPLLVRLPALQRALVKAQRQAERAQSLQASALVLQEQVTALERKSQTTQSRLARIKAAR
jgi:hypothetical protein